MFALLKTTPALTAAQLRAFQIYQDELLAWNEKFNLTSITTPDEIASKHFLDSLSLFALSDSSEFNVQRPTSNVQRLESDDQLPITNYQSASRDLKSEIKNLQLLDVGAGAGFPSIPLKIVRPQWRVTLLEATRKKCDFLTHLVKTLALGETRVVWGRAESIGHDAAHREQYDLVVARAVAELNVLVEYMLPFARVGGWCVAWKGDMIVGEVNAAKGAIAQLGGKLATVKQVQVPGIAQKRHLVVIEKIAATPDTFPRREGVAAKKPLK